MACSHLACHGGRTLVQHAWCGIPSSAVVSPQLSLCCVCSNALATVMSTAWMVVPRDMLYNSRTGTFFCYCLWYPNTLCTSCLCSLVQLNWCIHCHCRSSEAVRAVCTDWSLKWNCLVWLCENQPYQRAVVKVGDNVRLLLSWHGNFLQTCSLCSGCLI